MDLDEFDRLVGRIYEAAQQPAAWGSVLAELGDHIGLDGWNLLRFDRNAAQSPAVLAFGGERVSAQAAERYSEYYGAIDPRAHWLLSLPVGHSAVCHRQFNDRFVSSNEFYQDFLIPEGLRYALAGNLHVGEQHDYVLGLQRGPDRGHFLPDHEQLLARLMPHLTRAFRLMDQLHAQYQRYNAASAALDTTPMAVISLDEAGRVWHGNARGEQMLKAGVVLRVHAGFLTPANTNDERRFADALARCARSGQPTTLMLTRHERPADRFSATVLKPSTAPDTPLHALRHAGGLLCLVAPLTRRRLPTARQLITLFNLTPAEARLSRAVAAGESLEDYAEANGTKLSTVRTQLRAAFAKTGTDRQTALVRLIAGVPAVRE